MATPWKTSDQIVADVKRKISFPVSQNTFSDDDILAFANEEMAISQVPSVMEYHEEYFVYSMSVPLQTGKYRYAIPDRAVGMRLRDVFWADAANNYFEMTRISPDDKAFFQRNVGSNSAIHKYYLENNDVVLTPNLIVNPTGFLVFSFFLRPNQLVADSRAAICNRFAKKITLDNSALTAGDTLTINDVTLTAVVGAPAAFQFEIGVSSIASATNLAAAIVSNGLAPAASNGTPSSAIVIVYYEDLDTEITSSDSTAILIDSQQGIDFTSLPDIFVDGSVVDFLQTKPGHKIQSFDQEISSVSGTIAYFEDGVVPEDFIVGDYLCLQNESIIPMLPPDLHNVLTERTCSRILAAIGDVAGMQVNEAKIEQMEKRQGTLLDNRVEGSAQKITARHSILRMSKMGARRRL